VITSPDSDIVEDQIAAAAGSYNATASLNTSTAWLMQLAAFKAVLPTAPRLRVFPTNNTVVVAWPSSAASFTLQQNSDLAATGWIAVTNFASPAGDEYQVIVSPSSSRQFYRLKYP